jgi:DNA polymerase III delta prime subunit
MSPSPIEPTTLLENSLRSGRIHSAYLISGAGEAPRKSAIAFVRGLACSGDPSAGRPCEACAACHRSRESDADTHAPIELDGTGKKGPMFRHVGEHPDLFYVGRGAEDTRVRIGQVRALQHALRFAPNEGGWRAVVIDDAEMLNLEAQNALLHLLEEPPDRTSIVLLTRSASTLVPTSRSRCVRVIFPSEEAPSLYGNDTPEEIAELVKRLDQLHTMGMPELLDWAEEYRGARAVAAAEVESLLAVGSAWLRERVKQRVEADPRGVVAHVDAFKVLSRCRRDLVQRNANPQMVAERGLFAVREALAG